jgi:putative flippase GtrA
VRSARGLLARTTTPWRILLKELSAFGTVGVINLFVDIGLFNALHFGAGIGPLTSKVISTATATTSAYFMNRYWSFSHRARTGLAREYSLFFLLNGVALLMGLLVLGTTRYGLGLTDKLSINVANLVAIGVGTVFRFWAYRRWVFPPQPETGLAGTGLAGERAVA